MKFARCKVELAGFKPAAFCLTADALPPLVGGELQSQKFPQAGRFKLPACGFGRFSSSRRSFC